jgi:hypothetical protein
MEFSQAHLGFPVPGSPLLMLKAGTTRATARAGFSPQSAAKLSRRPCHASHAASQFANATLETCLHIGVENSPRQPALTALATSPYRIDHDGPP